MLAIILLAFLGLLFVCIAGVSFEDSAREGIWSLILGIFFLTLSILSTAYRENGMPVPTNRMKQGVVYKVESVTENNVVVTRDKDGRIVAWKMPVKPPEPCFVKVDTGDYVSASCLALPQLSVNQP